MFSGITQTPRSSQDHQITAAETSMKQATSVAGFGVFSGPWESESGDSNIFLSEGSDLVWV